MKNKEALLLLGEAYIPIQSWKIYGKKQAIRIHWKTFAYVYILIWYHEVVFPDDGKISRKESEKNSLLTLKASYIAIPLGTKTQS